MSLLVFVLLGPDLPGTGAEPVTNAPAVQVPAENLFAPGALHALQLELSPASREALRTAPRRFVPATLRYAGHPPWPVEVRLKGETGSARPVDDKPSWTLDFGRPHSSPDSTSPARPFLGLGRIQLHNSVEDPSYFHEWLGGHVFRAAGIPYPRVTHALVTLNGKPLGLYVLREGFTETFLAAQLPPGDGALYDNDSGREVGAPLHVNVTRGPAVTAAGAEHWRRLADAVREPEAERAWELLGEHLDRNQFLAFISTEVVLGHRDGYALARNNFRVYYDPTRGHLVFLPDGLDQLLGSADLPWQPHFSGLLAQAVLRTPPGRERYRTHVEALLAGAAAESRVLPLLDAATSRLRGQLPAADRAPLEREHRDLAQRYRQRLASLRAQLQTNDPPRVSPGPDGVALGHWQAWDAGDALRLDQSPAPDGTPSLHFVATGRSSASWRTRIQLPAGHFVVRGRGWVRGVEPIDPRRPQGLALRQAGKPRPAAGLTGDSPAWQDLATTVVVPSDTAEATEVLVEFTARTGEGWVALESLRVLPEAPESPRR